MKFLLILTFCSSYFFVTCAVSKCYHANNIDLYSSNLTNEECKPPYSDFCGTSTWKNGDVPWGTCGDDEYCTSKGCCSSMHCTKPGTYGHDYPGLSNVKYTVTCCDTNLCNVQSTAKTLYEISFSCLFYMSVYYIYFITL